MELPSGSKGAVQFSTSVQSVAWYAGIDKSGVKPFSLNHLSWENYDAKVSRIVGILMKSTKILVSYHIPSKVLQVSFKNPFKCPSSIL